MSKARHLLVAAVVVAAVICPLVTEVSQPTAAASGSVRTQASSTTVKLSNATVAYGDEQAERFEVTVSPQSSGSMPTGPVWIVQFAQTFCTATLTSGKGSCTLSPDQLAPGVYHLVATYGGSADYNGSASAQETFTVRKAASKITLKLSPAKVAYGGEQAERLEVTVSLQFSPSMPTGTVTIMSSAGRVCVIELSAGKGSCRLTPKKLRVRTYVLVATYSGSTAFKRSISIKNVLTVTKGVARTPTTTTKRPVVSLLTACQYANTVNEVALLVLEGGSYNRKDLDAYAAVAESYSPAFKTSMQYLLEAISWFPISTPWVPDAQPGGVDYDVLLNQIEGTSTWLAIACG
jgi:FlaG/FlaF family flagellin (archaellin)